MSIALSKIAQALYRHGLPLDSRVGEELDRSAVIGGGFQPEIMIRDGNRVITLDQRIGELRNDPNFRDCFPATRTVSRDNEEAIRAEFDAIARGTTVVV
jgi:hypothetical protein